MVLKLDEKSAFWLLIYCPNLSSLVVPRKSLDIDAAMGPDETPAAKAINRLSAKRIAARCDVCTDAVWKWRNRNGGLIPAQHQGAILQLARELGVELHADDLIMEAAA